MWRRVLSQTKRDSRERPLRTLVGRIHDLRPTAKDAVVGEGTSAPVSVFLIASLSVNS